MREPWFKGMDNEQIVAGLATAPTSGPTDPVLVPDDFAKEYGLIVKVADRMFCLETVRQYQQRMRVQRQDRYSKVLLALLGGPAAMWEPADLALHASSIVDQGFDLHPFERESMVEPLKIRNETGEAVESVVTGPTGAVAELSDIEKSFLSYVEALEAQGIDEPETAWAAFSEGAAAGARLDRRRIREELLAEIERLRYVVHLSFEAQLKLNHPHPKKDVLDVEPLLAEIARICPEVKS